MAAFKNFRYDVSLFHSIIFPISFARIAFEFILKKKWIENSTEREILTVWKNKKIPSIIIIISWNPVTVNSLLWKLISRNFCKNCESKVPYFPHCVYTPSFCLIECEKENYIFTNYYSFYYEREWARDWPSV